MNYELREEFFNRSSVIIAKDLIGKYLCRKLRNGKIARWKIVEIEAYEGPNDLASHASKGQTPRNAPMFRGPGTIYTYFIYGMHWMFNIVCGPAGHPAAVLIRGITSPPIPPLGKERGVISSVNFSGPARLTKYLKIDGKLNGKKLGQKTGLWIEPPSLKASACRGKIIKLPRVGVTYAGPVWSKKKYRFLLKNL